MVLFAPLWATVAPAESSSDRALSLLLDELAAAGYTDLSVTSRLLGGYVIEAQKDTVAVVIAVDGADYSVTYSELLTGGEGGFFATPRRPPGGGVETVLSNYAARLGSASGPADALPPDAYAGADTPNPRTAAFFQSQTITASGDTALIRRSETLGVPSLFTTETETRVTVDGATTHRMEHETTYSVDQVSSAVTMDGMSGFSQQIFSDPVGFRNSLAVDVSIGTLPQMPVTDGIVNQVVSSIEANVAQMPEAGRVVLPSDLRGQVSQQLTPDP